MLQSGDKAPSFSLPIDGGDLLTLDELQGPVILYFYPKDDTPGCTTQANDFNTHLEDFAAIGVTVIGVSPDSVARHEKFKTKHGLKFNLISDEDQTALNDYQVWVEKSMYGRKFMGVERTTFMIDADKTITMIWRKVKVKGHVEAVLAEARQRYQVN